MRLQGVRPSEVEFRAVQLPPNVGVVMPVCRAISLAQIVDEVCPMAWHGELTHGQVIEAMVLSIVQSDTHRWPLYRFEDWAAKHSLNLFYDCPAGAFNDDRLGRALDALVPPQARSEPDGCNAEGGEASGALPMDEIEARVVTEAISRYNIEVQAIHWDLTNVTFWGDYEGADLIGPGFGHGTVNRRQVQVSLSVSSPGGIPLHHLCVPSRAQQQPLAEDVLKTLQERLARTNLIVVADSKGVSHEIIGKYRQAKAHFIAPLKPTAQQAQRLAAIPLEQFEPLDYSTVSGPQERYQYYATTLALCPTKCKEVISVDALFMHSTGKQRRDEKTRRKHLDKGYKRLEEIKGYLNRGQYFRAEYAAEQLAKAVPQDVHDIVCYSLEGEDGKLELRWWSDLDAYREAAVGDGRYILIYDLPADKQPCDAFYLYKRQHLVEARHRGLKSDLEVNPVWLKKENRVLALVFVFILALIVFSLLGLCSERAGLTTERYPKMTARELLCRFGGISMNIAQIRDGPTHYEISLTIEQAYLLSELNFPKPGSLLPNLKPDQTVGANE